MAQLLQPGQVQILTGLGLVDVGEHALGISQGSILAILHIGVFFDLLLEKQNKGEGLITPYHQQQRPPIPVGAIKFVDDRVDVGSTETGINQ